MYTLTERVKRGMKWLDRNDKIVPRNWRSILAAKVDSFRFANPDFGPIGQLFDNNYYRALYKLKIVGGGGGDFGFRTNYNVHGDANNLFRLWKHVLRTDKAWSKLTNTSITRTVRGAQFTIYQVDVNVYKIMKTLGEGRTTISDSHYTSYDSAKRHVRNLISKNGI